MCGNVVLMLIIFGLLAAIFSTMQYIPYIFNVLKGKTQPQRAGWFIWFVLGIVMFVSQLAKGGEASLWIVLVHIVGNGLIFLLSFKYGDKSGFSRRDYYTLIAAAFGIVLWVITNEPVLALLIAIAVDALGAVLIGIKAYKRPFEETLMTWVLGAVAGVCSILAVKDMSSVLVIYPIYAALNAGLIAAVVIVRRKRLMRAQPLPEQPTPVAALEPAD
ncbi:MAG TPA: hypothetical protein VFO38_01075 [Candidatus Saccharimonadales bacterium]|nr:hypothetical protein [Candidatus Saccharimonadales bacterium]